uniref:Uncharacterized protein n=1 Tax=Amphimedon queenslandica TaxID=400682 RepID=A0A1X7UL69_AMPQE
ELVLCSQTTPSVPLGGSGQLTIPQSFYFTQKWGKWMRQLTTCFFVAGSSRAGPKRQKTSFI